MIRIRIAETAQDKDIANKIILDFHSYVNTPKVVGRCIKYVISYNDKDVATFWLGSGFKPTPKAILNYFEVSQKEFDKIFNEVADNKRFCIKENPIPNFGSQILSRIRKRAKADWFQKYGNNLKGILTTIGNDKNGSVYLADNWKVIGKTAGLPKRNKSVSMKWNNKKEIAERFVKPTGENKKLIMLTTVI
tara:strand:- start:163 stop:735 length:573 start_codon:yes stop_codon:yes gene_type:complete